MKWTLILFVLFCLICSTESAAQNSAPYALDPKRKQTLPGQQACITIKTADDDPSDTVRISWSTTVQTATFTHNSGAVQHAEGQICWTPTNSHPRHEPYLFFITLDDGHVQVVDTFLIMVLGFPARDSLFFEEGACGELEILSQVNDWTDFVWYRFHKEGQFGDTVTVYQKRIKFTYTRLISGTYILETRVWHNFPLWRTYYDTIVLENGHDLSSKMTLLAEPNQFSIKVTNKSIDPEVKYDWAKLNSLGLTILPDSTPEIIIQVWEHTLVRAVVSSAKPCNDTLWFELNPEPSSVMELDGGAIIYPNPCIDEIRIESLKPMLSLTLFDIQGKQAVLQEETASLSTKLEVAGLPKGTYLLAIRYMDGSAGHHTVVFR